MIWSFLVIMVKNKPTCARVAAMTTWAQNKTKKHSFNAKFSFSHVLPYAWCSLLSQTCLHTSLEMQITCSLSAWTVISISFILVPTFSWHEYNIPYRSQHDWPVQLVTVATPVPSDCPSSSSVHRESKDTQLQERYDRCCLPGQR